MLMAKGGSGVEIAASSQARKRLYGFWLYVCMCTVAAWLACLLGAAGMWKKEAKGGIHLNDVEWKAACCKQHPIEEGSLSGERRKRKKALLPANSTLRP